MTEGTSAELTISWSPDATTLTGDQPLAVRSTNFSAVVPPVPSIQLRIARPSETVICGAMLPVAAGDASSFHSGAAPPVAMG